VIEPFRCAVKRKRKKRTREPARGSLARLASFARKPTSLVRPGRSQRSSHPWNSFSARRLTESSPEIGQENVKNKSRKHQACQKQKMNRFVWQVAPTKLDGLNLQFFKVARMRSDGGSISNWDEQIIAPKIIPQRDGVRMSKNVLIVMEQRE